MKIKVLNNQLISTLAKVAVFSLAFQWVQASERSAQTTCDFEAFVMERDPKGLNVREKPNSKSKILGTISPAIFEKPGNGSRYLIKPELRVVGSKDGWFKIEGAKDNETLIETLADIKPRKMFSGAGWVSGKMLTVKSQANAAYSKPSKNSEVLHKKSEELSFDSLESYKLKDCVGEWVRVIDGRLKEKNLYWLNSICGLQETACSGLGDD